jgi:hypothetical protein
VNAVSLTLIDTGLAAAEVGQVVELPVAQLTPAYGAEPWSRADLVGFGAMTAVGGALLGLGWFGAADRLELGRQVAYLNIGVAGLLVGAAGGLSWLRSGLRSVRTRKAGVLAELRTQTAGAAPDVTVATATAAYVASDAMTRYHRPGCSFVAGKEVAASTLVAHTAAGRKPCGMCVR